MSKNTSGERTYPYPEHPHRHPDILICEFGIAYGSKAKENKFPEGDISAITGGHVVHPRT